MHWSRIVDIPIAGAILLLRPFVGSHMAEWCAAFIVPLLTLLALMTVLARHTARQFGRGAALFACILTVTTIPVIQQLQPYRIDHHGWQLVCAALLMAGLCDQRAQRGSWIAGVAMAVWMAISMEGLPLAVASLCVLGLAWVFRSDPNDGVRLEGYAIALAFTSIVLWVFTRVTENFAVWCDALSMFHLATFVVVAGGIAITRWIAHGAVTRFAGLSVTALLAAVVMAIAAPQCVTGAFNDLPPLVLEYWYKNVAEGLPIWRQAPRTIWSMIALLPVTVWGLVLMMGSKIRKPVDWALIGGMVAASTLVSILVARASGAAAVIAIPVVAFVTRTLFDRARALSGTGSRILATVGAILLLIPGILLAPFIPVDRARAGFQNGYQACVPPRQMQRVGTVVDEFAQGRNVLAPLDISPSLILVTDLTVVASGHHRNKFAMNDVIRFWVGSPEQAREITKARQIDFVMYCPGLAEPRNYSHRRPNGMMARLIGGRVPAWLDKVQDPRLGSAQLYRVLP